MTKCTELPWPEDCAQMRNTALGKNLFPMPGSVCDFTFIGYLQVICKALGKSMQGDIVELNLIAYSLHMMWNLK